MIECTEGHYEVHKTSYGEAYVWCPGCVVVECDCGERPVLRASDTTCRCGVDHESLVRGVLGPAGSSEEALHPWEAEYQEWRKEQHPPSEASYWLEWKVIE